MAKNTKSKPTNPFDRTKKPNKKHQNPSSSSSKLAPKKTITTKPPKIKKHPISEINKQTKNNDRIDKVKSGGGGPTGPAAEQLSFFIHQNQLSKRNKLSSLELEPLTEKCMIELKQDPAQNAGNLGEYMKAAFGKSWGEVLCEKQVQEGKVEPGNPALLVVSSSALRALELLRELRPVTAECKPAKLFAKHMKIDEQVSFLKNRVNVASGTPSRIKKLIDMEALGISRLLVVVIDMHTDVKGYSLLTLNQVRDEFWDLYRTCFHQRVADGDMRICFYGQLPDIKTSTNDDDEE